MSPDILIEGLLFYRAAPLTKQAIKKTLDLDDAQLAAAIGTLKNRLQGGALCIIETTTEIQLATTAELAPFIDNLRKSDIKNDIGKAGAETLAIILYRAPISRAEIDRIRGVNSSFILRNLMVRGLIERTPAETGGGYVFTITPALLAQLGVTTTHELTDFAHVMNALEQFETTNSHD